jgi:hypothetical protein
MTRLAILIVAAAVWALIHLFGSMGWDH